MSIAKHTPGPWELVQITPSYLDIMAKGQYICYVLSEETANAKLIAAAPELLTQLKMFVVAAMHIPKGQSREFDKEVSNALAMIDKIEGV